MKKIFTLLSLVFVIGLNAQFNINSIGVPLLIDFDGFKADSAAAPGAIGGINTNWFAIKGFTGTNAVNNVDFGTINNSPKLKLGTSSGGATTGASPTASGIYSFRTDINDTSDRAFGFQSTANDLTPGSIYFKIKNTSGQTINSLIFSFTLEVKNNENRANNVQLYHGLDSLAANLGGTYVSPAAADASPVWIDTTFVLNLLNINLAVNAEYYFLIKTDDVSGSGSRDEFAINDLAIFASGSNPTGVLNSDFTINDSVICEGESVIFTNTTSSNPPSTNIIYFWNFGDGSVNSNVTSPIHPFDSAGMFTVTLIAVDTLTFLIDTMEKNITVYKVPESTFTITNNGAGNYTFTAPFIAPSNYIYNWTVNGIASGTSQPTLNQTFTTGTNKVCLTVINPLGPCPSLTYCDSISVLASTLAPNTLNNRVEIKIYPNPTKDYVQLENVSSKTMLKIYNALGQVVRQEQLNTDVKLQLEELKVGFYFVELKSAFGTKTIKLIIQ